MVAWWHRKRGLTITHVRIPIPEFAGGGHVDIPKPIRNEFHQVEIAGKTTTVRIPVWAREVPMPERPDKRWM